MFFYRYFAPNGAVCKSILYFIHVTNTKGEDKVKPNWEEYLNYIKKGGGQPIPVSVTCDIFIHNETTNIKYAFELKTPLPNGYQIKASKEKMLKLLTIQPKQVDYAFYALVYNPYDKKEDYNWIFLMRWFNMHKDSAVLIGNEFWDLIGGEGTYEAFIKEVNKLGRGYKERIYREFLEIEPPQHVEQTTLK